MVVFRFDLLCFSDSSWFFWWFFWFFLFVWSWFNWWSCKLMLTIPEFYPFLFQKLSSIHCLLCQFTHGIFQTLPWLSALMSGIVLPLPEITRIYAELPWQLRPQLVPNLTIFHLVGRIPAVSCHDGNLGLMLQSWNLSKFLQETPNHSQFIF